MTKLTATCFAVFLSLVFVSCQKEVEQNGPLPNTNSSIQGDYKFVSTEIKSVSTVQVRDGSEVARTVSYNHYFTKNNQGNAKIDAQIFKVENLAYTIDTTFRAVTYLNGIKEDDSTIPFSFTLPPTTSTTPYKLIGADSIYFSSGTMLVGSMPEQAGMPSGAKYRTEGKKLIIDQNLYQATTRTIEGLTYTMQTEGSAKIIMQKL